MKVTIERMTNGWSLTACDDHSVVVGRVDQVFPMTDAQKESLARELSDFRKMISYVPPAGVKVETHPMPTTRQWVFEDKEYDKWVAWDNMQELIVKLLMDDNREE